MAIATATATAAMATDMAHGTRQTTRHAVRDTRHAAHGTCDTRHVKPDKWRGDATCVARSTR
eukprot:4775011-Lingulodinium_polyedra.AAC.1